MAAPAPSDRCDLPAVYAARRAAVRELHAAGLDDAAIRDRRPDLFTPDRAGREQVFHVRYTKLGLPSNSGYGRRRFPPDTYDRIRTLHAEGLDDGEIFDRLRDYLPPIRDGYMFVAGVRIKRLKLPCVRRPHRVAVCPSVRPRLTALHAEGLCDREILWEMWDVFGAHPRPRVAVSAVRKRLGLPRSPDGVGSDTGPARRLAERWGLPPDLRLRQTQIVLVLTAGPASRAAIVAATVGNGRMKGTGKTSRAGRDVDNLADLVGRGLVVKLPVGGGKFLYTLSGACLEMLRAAADRLAGRGDDDAGE